MGAFYIFRNVVLGLCLLLTIPNLGLTAHWTQGSNLDHTTYSFEGMGLTISIISFVIFPVMLVLPEFRQNAFILYVFSELIIVGLLWVLWMTAAILVIEQRESFYPLNDCSVGLGPNQQHWCNEIMAIQGLSITIFVFLILYLFILLIFAFVKHSQGKMIWGRSVKDIQVTIPDLSIPLTHNSAEMNGQQTANAVSLFGSPATYPPDGPTKADSYNQSSYSSSMNNIPMQVQHQPSQIQAQHQPSQIQVQYQPSQMQIQPTGHSEHQPQQQVTQSVVYSRSPPGVQYPQSMPMQQISGQYVPSSGMPQVVQV